MYTKMNTFPMSSEQLRKRSRFCSLPYQEIVKNEIERITEMVIKDAKAGYPAMLLLPIRNPLKDDILLTDPENLKDFDYNQYVKDIATQIAKNFPTSDIEIDYGLNRVQININWSKDYKEVDESLLERINDSLPMTSKQLRELSPTINVSYEELVKKEVDALSQCILDISEYGYSKTIAALRVENPLSNRHLRIEGMNMFDIEDHTFYSKYLNDVQSNLQKNFPSCKITYDHLLYNDSYYIDVDWSQDFMNPEEMFSD